MSLRAGVSGRAEVSPIDAQAELKEVFLGELGEDAPGRALYGLVP